MMYFVRLNFQNVNSIIKEFCDIKEEKDTGGQKKPVDEFF